MASDHASSEHHAARFSDGRSAQSRDASVRMGERGLEIAIAGEALREWRYGSLSATEPFTSHSIDALVTSDDEEGATLFVTSAAFARALPARAPQLSARAQRWRHAKPWVAATAAIAALVASFWVFDYSPAHAIAELLPRSVREGIGRDALTSMAGERKQCSSTAGDAALQTLVSRLAASRPEAKFSVSVLDWGVMNAFALPGDRIILSRGLLDKAESADEVAGVLAHEMGHALALDPETGLVRAIGLVAGAQLLLGGSGGALTNIGVTLAQLSYSRAAEHAADLTGLQLLKAAKISPDGFGQFFERVMKIEGDTDPDRKTGRGLDMLRSHPVTAERRKLVAEQPRYDASPSLSKRQFQALKGICGGGASPKAPPSDGTMSGNDI